MAFLFGSDEALIQACRRGQKGAWDEFLRRFSRLIYWSIRRSTRESEFEGREDFVADVFQDIFQKLFEKKAMDGLDDIEGLKKYLVVLSAHQTLDRIKSISRHEKKSVFLDASSELLNDGSQSQTNDISAHPDPAGQASRNETQVIISGVLSELGARERTCIEFHVFYGKTHGDISKLLGLPIDTVSSVIRRAKDKIREKLLKKGLFE